MGKQFSLTAADNFKLGAYRADPADRPRAAIVVIQEIFGVNHHIRAVCDRLAGEGYAAVAPAMFDRSSKGFRVRLLRRTKSPMPANSSPIPNWDAMMQGHPGRHRRAQEGRPGRDHRLLHGRQHRLPRGAQAERTVRRDRLLRRPDRQESPTRSRRCRRRCISARRTHRSR